jgi:hypothetical protein
MQIEVKLKDYEKLKNDNPIYPRIIDKWGQEFMIIDGILIVMVADDIKKEDIGINTHVTE